MVMVLPEKQTLTSMSEFWEELEERIAACDRVIKCLRGYVELYPNSPRTSLANNSINKYLIYRSQFLNQQTSVEEWLIDHNAQGWVAS